MGGAHHSEGAVRTQKGSKDRGATAGVRARAGKAKPNLVITLAPVGWQVIIAGQSLGANGMREISKLLLAFAAVLSLMLLTTTAFAGSLGGCVDSPENPTLLLGLLGGGAASVPWLRARFKQRRPSQRNSLPD